MVVTRLPATLATGVTQARMAVPSRCTVHAPHWGDAAAKFCAVQCEIFAQRPEQRHLRIDIQGHRLVINSKLDHSIASGH